MRQGGRQLGALIALVAALLLTAAPAGAATRLVRIGQAPALPAGTQPLAGVASSTPIRITVALAPRRSRALAAFAAAVSDPTSVSYRRYLRPAAFARRFAPTAQTVATVLAALRADGLRPGAVTANGLSVRILSTVGAVERAFSISLARVALADGQRAIVNTSAPAVPAAVAPAIQSIIGLTSLVHPRALLQRPAARAATAKQGHVATGGPQPCAAATSAGSSQSAYTIDQVASAYDFSSLYKAGDEGAGQTIALYELEPDSPSDIAAYQSCYGTHATVDYVSVDGGAGSGAGSGEAALDIEQLIAFAPQARIVVYQGPNSNLDTPGSGPYDIYAQIVSQDVAQVASNSWGQCEPVEGGTDASAESTLFEEAAIQGQTFLSASGDDGAQDCDGGGALPDVTPAVDDPASQPYVTGVGGTSLKTLGPPPGETVWNNGGSVTALLGEGLAPGAGGGGVSALWPMPVYQSSSPSSLGVLNADSSASPCHASRGDCREVPDVAASADPAEGYVIYWNGSGSQVGQPVGWQGIGGTSAGAPLWAALIALANDEPGCAGVPLGFVNPVLYRLAGEGQTTYFNDITSGDNDYTGTNSGRYAAAAGYDMASGLGSPKAGALAPALCRQGLRFSPPTAVESFRGVATSYQLAAADAAGAGLRYLATGLPSGIRLGAASGHLSGRGSVNGKSHVTVEALDDSGAVRVGHFTWTVAGAPSVRTKLTGVGGGSPTLSLRFAAGRGGAPLHAVLLTLPSGLRAGAVKRELSVTGAAGRKLKVAIVVHGAKITVVTSTGSSRLTLTFHGGALIPSPGLRSSARAGGHPTVRLALLVGDTAAASDTLSVKSRAAS